MKVLIFVAHKTERMYIEHFGLPAIFAVKVISLMIQICCDIAVCGFFELTTEKLCIVCLIISGQVRT